MKVFITVFLLLFSGMAFSQTSETLKTGNFGGNGTNAPKIELKEDHTFYYLDLTNLKTPIEFTGTWSVNNGKLQLSTPKAVSRKAMTRFKVIRDGQCIQAKKGFTFYTLCIC